MFETQIGVALLLAVVVALVVGYTRQWAGRTRHGGERDGGPVPRGASWNELCRRDGTCVCWSRAGVDELLAR